jgi:hypothetical protein
MRSAAASPPLVVAKFSPRKENFRRIDEARNPTSAEIFLVVDGENCER